MCESYDDELLPAIVREDADDQLSEIATSIPPVYPSCVDPKHSALLAQLLLEEVDRESTSEESSPVGKSVLHLQHACSGESAAQNTGATLSIEARRLLKNFKKANTVAISIGDGQTIHSLGGVDVSICLGNKSLMQHCRVLVTDAFDIVIGTNVLRKNPQVKVLSLKRPYALHCNFGSRLFSSPLKLSG